MRYYHPPRYRVMLVKESGVTARDVRISDSNKVHRFLAPLFDGLDRGHFMVVGLDAKHAVIGINTVSIGSGSAEIGPCEEVNRYAGDHWRPVGLARSRLLHRHTY